jgi:hypothetical protein
MDDHLYLSSQSEDLHRINPSTGMVMTGLGLDAGGNGYGHPDRPICSPIEYDETGRNNNGWIILIGAIIIFSIIFFG